MWNGLFTSNQLMWKGDCSSTVHCLTLVCLTPSLHITMLLKFSFHISFLFVTVLSLDSLVYTCTDKTPKMTISKINDNKIWHVNGLNWQLSSPKQSITHTNWQLCIHAHIDIITHVNVNNDNVQHSYYTLKELKCLSDLAKVWDRLLPSCSLPPQP